MLALHNPRRQHLHTNTQPLHHNVFTTSSTHLPLPERISQQQSPFNLKLLEVYLQNTPAPIDTSTGLDLPNAEQYMSAYTFQSPAIRVQPVPQLATDYSQPSLALDTTSAQQSWDMYGQHAQMGTNTQLQTPMGRRKSRTHQRATSSSSIGSNSSASTFDSGHATGYSFGQAEHLPSASTKVDSSSYNTGKHTRGFSNHLPTPSDTPTQDSFLAPSFPSYNAQHSTEGPMAAHFAMKNMLMDQGSVADEEAPGFTHSGRHSVSSYNSPATPAHNDDFDEKFKVPHDVPSYNPPKLDRTVSDMYKDELYNPAGAAPTINTSVPSQNDSKLLSPYNTLNQRLHAANHARSQSPSGSMSRGPSPFRQGSPLAPTHNRFGSHSMSMGFQQAQLIRQQKQEEEATQQQRQIEAHILAGQQEPKTISPKDALLEYHETEEDTKVPLFSDGSNQVSQSYGGGNQYATATQAFDNAPDLSYGLGTNRKENWSTATRQSPSQYSASSQSHSNFNFVPPSVPGMMHGMPLSAPQYRSATSLQSQQEQTPEFPAHLTSMESSASEAGPETSSVSSDFQKPAASSADTGTYTCTYHGCTLRFETPQKLQKHKREGHRQNVVGQPTQGTTPGVGSGMTSAALLARNSQAGPHKCERINPTTGKPCNTVFSRPYDLTRHEDTIHNARKQKVRCALCVEEKSFSRNDALTRHMRVVHPEVDFPGKHRKRGGHG